MPFAELTVHTHTHAHRWPVPGCYPEAELAPVTWGMSWGISPLVQWLSHPWGEAPSHPQTPDSKYCHTLQPASSQVCRPPWAGGRLPHFCSDFGSEAAPEAGAPHTLPRSLLFFKLGPSLCFSLFFCLSLSLGLCPPSLDLHLPMALLSLGLLFLVLPSFLPHPFISVQGAAYLLCDLRQEALPPCALISHLYCGTHRADLKLKVVTTYPQGTWYTVGAQSRPQPTLVTLPQALG